MSPNALTYTCTVCEEHAEASMTAECNWCNGRYHLNQRNDVEAKDCGQVWVDEQYLALQFACDTCLASTARHAVGPETQTGSPTPARAAPARSAANARVRRYKRRA